MEDEIDGNLGKIGDAVSQLGKYAKIMGSELDKQNDRIDRIGSKSTKLEDRLRLQTDKVSNS